MLKPSQLMRSAAIAITLAALSASTAMAIPSNQALPSEHASDAAITTPAPPSTPARVEGMGVQPPVSVAPAPGTEAVPLTTADEGGGVDPLLIGIAGAGALLLLLIVAVVRTDRQLRHPLRARQL
jgi:hypothetical protein